jgi:light-regulated signal transduction histidine kinase (bacteriophytochrome)
LTPEAPEIRVENRFLAHGGEKWTLWTNRALAFDADGRVSEAQATGIDITDRKKAEEALRRANEDLERFAYSASHDLQEPIRNIALAAEMLAHHNQSRLEPNGFSQLVFIQESARRMTELIRDLLAYTQIVSIEETVPREANATKALEKALASLSAFIVETEAKVISEPLPSVRMPEIQLQQVFQNLISNAIKYRKDDQKPIMRIRADRKGAEWLVSVQDNGIGIPPEYHERIFGVFKRLHGYGKYAGSGIGLAICKRIVERHGGRIWVESDGTTGSTFYFALPAESGL